MTGNRVSAASKNSLKFIIRKIANSVSMIQFVPSATRVQILSWVGVQFIDKESAWVGSGVYFDNLNPEKITIGRSCRITTGVRILTHHFDARHQCDPNWPFNFYIGSVKVGDYVFIGSGAIIVKSVEIGDWAVIGANTVISRDVPKGAIMAGNPASIVGYRAGFSSDDT